VWNRREGKGREGKGIGWLKLIITLHCLKLAREQDGKEGEGRWWKEWGRMINQRVEKSST